MPARQVPTCACTWAGTFASAIGIYRPLVTGIFHNLCEKNTTVVFLVYCDCNIGSNSKFTCFIYQLLSQPMALWFTFISFDLLYLENLSHACCICLPALQITSLWLLFFAASLYWWQGHCRIQRNTIHDICRAMHFFHPKCYREVTISSSRGNNLHAKTWTLSSVVCTCQM